jgi:hypothetical protein
LPEPTSSDVSHADVADRGVLGHQPTPPWTLSTTPGAGVWGPRRQHSRPHSLGDAYPWPFIDTNVVLLVFIVPGGAAAITGAGADLPAPACAGAGSA